MRIILSYRKFNTGDTARRIQTILSSAFGPNNVIAGTESLINYNTDGENVVIEAVMNVDALLVLIDRDWLAGGWASDYTDSDVVALNTALFEPSTQVIPLLLDGASMPSASELPVTLHELPRQRVIRISSATLEADIGRLIQQLDPKARISQSSSPAYGYGQPQQQAYIYQQQIPVVNYQRTTTTDPNIIFVVDLLAGLFGFVGIGHMINGQIAQGLGYMIGYWVWIAIALMLTVVTIGFFGCIAVPISFGIIFYSASQARQYALGG